jgi:hypothetical protein
VRRARINILQRPRHIKTFLLDREGEKKCFLFLAIPTIMTAYFGNRITRSGSRGTGFGASADQGSVSRQRGIRRGNRIHHPHLRRVPGGQFREAAMDNRHVLIPIGLWLILWGWLARPIYAEEKEGAYRPARESFLAAKAVSLKDSKRAETMTIDDGKTIATLAKIFEEGNAFQSIDGKIRKILAGDRTLKTKCFCEEVITIRCLDTEGKALFFFGLHDAKTKAPRCKRATAAYSGGEKPLYRIQISCPDRFRSRLIAFCRTSMENLLGESRYVIGRLAEKAPGDLRLEPSKELHGKETPSIPIRSVGERPQPGKRMLFRLKLQRGEAVKPASRVRILESIALHGGRRALMLRGTVVHIPPGKRAKVAVFWKSGDLSTLKRPKLPTLCAEDGTFAIPIIDFANWPPNRRYSVAVWLDANLDNAPDGENPVVYGEFLPHGPCWRDGKGKTVGPVIKGIRLDLGKKTSGGKQP